MTVATEIAAPAVSRGGLSVTQVGRDSCTISASVVPVAMGLLPLDRRIGQEALVPSLGRVSRSVASRRNRLAQRRPPRAVGGPNATT